MFFQMLLENKIWDVKAITSIQIVDKINNLKSSEENVQSTLYIDFAYQ